MTPDRAAPQPRYAMRFNGGPLDGSTTREMTRDWPPPDEFVVPNNTDGFYRKLYQSHMPGEVAHPNVIRSAEYGWQTGAPTYFSPPVLDTSRKDGAP